MRRALPIIAAIAAAAAGTPALASDIIWFDSDHTAYGGDQPNGAGRYFTGGGVSVRVSGWTLKSDGKIYQAQLGVWPEGLGVRTGSSDNSHTIDNSGSIDFVLLQFNKTVELDMALLQTGWHNMNDTDATVGYATTAVPYTTVLSYNGQPLSALNFINKYDSGSYGNSGDSYRDINPSNHAGNLWLIGASFTNPDGSRKLDGFKIEKLTFNKIPPPPPTGGVPEPATWATMLIGFFGLAGAMRSSARRRARTASADLAKA